MVLSWSLIPSPPASCSVRISNKAQYDFRLDEQDWSKVCWGRLSKADARSLTHQMSRRAKWAAVIRRATSPEGGGWPQDFTVLDMTVERLQALARIIDDEFFQGTFHRNVSRRMRRAVSYTLVDRQRVYGRSGPAGPPDADVIASVSQMPSAPATPDWQSWSWSSSASSAAVTAARQRVAQRRSGLAPLVLVRHPEWGSAPAAAASESCVAAVAPGSCGSEERRGGGGQWGWLFGWWRRRRSQAGEGSSGCRGGGGGGGNCDSGVGAGGGGAMVSRVSPPGACCGARAGVDVRKPAAGRAAGAAAGTADGAAGTAEAKAVEEPRGASAAYHHSSGRVMFCKQVWSATPAVLGRPIRMDGIRCYSKLSWLAHTLGHEMLHVMLLSMCDPAARDAPSNMSLEGHGYNFLILNWYVLGHRGYTYDPHGRSPRRPLPYRL